MNGDLILICLTVLVVTAFVCSTIQVVSKAKYTPYYWSMKDKERKDK
jgi:hypothetical protein